MIERAQAKQASKQSSPTKDGGFITPSRIGRLWRPDPQIYTRMAGGGGGGNSLYIGTPSGPSWLQNKPSGAAWSLLTERPFDAQPEDGWNLVAASGSTGNFSIIADITGLKSPQHSGRILFPAGFASGGEPCNVYRDLPVWYKENYVCMAFQMGNPWVGNDSGINKIIHTFVNGSNRLFYFARGSGSSNLAACFGLQGLAGAGFDAGAQGGEGSGVSCNLLPNQGLTATLVRGQYHQWEAHYSAGTPGNADGFVKWWLDGQLVGSYVNIPFVAAAGSAAWESFQWAPTYGGAGSPVPANQYQFMDHVVLFGRN